MDSHWEPNSTQLKRLREIANGGSGMAGHHHSIRTMDVLIRHGLVNIRTIEENGRPFTGYFVTEKGAQALDDAIAEDC